MPRMRRWVLFAGVIALAFGWLLFRGAFESEADRWPSAAEQEAEAREYQDRQAKEMEEATRGVPYRMNWPFGPLSRKGSGFQIAVKGDEVGFYQPQPAVLPPPDVWLIYLTIEYNDSQKDPAQPVDTTPRLRITDQRIEPFRIERGRHPHEDELILPSVAYADGSSVRFHCIGSGFRDMVRTVTTAAELAQIDPAFNARCRTFLGIRHGIRLMVQFPIIKADVAHLGVTRAIALMDRAIVDQPQGEN